jgi:hypothetical protein
MAPGDCDHWFWVAPGAFNALANSFAFADFCGAVNARGIGAIAPGEAVNEGVDRLPKTPE